MLECIRNIGKVLLVGRKEDKGRSLPSDFSELDAEIFEIVQPYTKTSPERIFALIRSVEYILARGIPGAVVECGVWRGGSMLAAVKTLQRLGCRDRKLYLFDTFEGMPQPGEYDVQHTGVAAALKFEKLRRPSGGSDWCYADIEEVRRVLFSTGYDPSRFEFVKGKVEDTLPDAAPDEISILRLDTDWYDSTLWELECLFPRLSKGGVLIIDDYGHWKGARRAVDEYFEKHQIQILLNRIDYTGRVGIKY